MSSHGDTPNDHQDEQATRDSTDAAADRQIQQIDHFVRLMRITHEAIVCADESCGIVVFNQGAEKLFHYNRDEIIGHQLTTLVCPRYQIEQKHRFSALQRIAKENQLGFHTDRIICKRRGGERFPTEISLSQNLISGRRLYTLIIRDMTQRLIQESQLAYRAEHDELTDLPNRNLLTERLTAGIARAHRNHRKLGVVYLDLDNFKPVNDRYGHEAGDCLLQAVAGRLRDTVRQSDIVSRIGGDEFIVCVEQIKGKQDANDAAAKILDAFRKPFMVLGTQVEVSASIGVAIYPDHGEDVSTLIRNADQAMYLAKENGGSPRLFPDQF